MLLSGVAVGTGLTGSVAAQQTGPSISAFSVDNPSGQPAEVSFDSDEQVTTISVSVGDDVSGTTLSASDFTSGDATNGYTYTATLSDSSDGTFSATLDTAEDAAGNDGASGESDTVTVS